MRNFVERIEFLSKRSFVGNLIFLPRQFKNKHIRTLVKIPRKSNYKIISEMIYFVEIEKNCD